MKRTYSVIAGALSFSLFVYLFYRSTKTVVNELIVLFMSPATYSEIRSHIGEALPLSEPILYSLPGGLWVFCLTVLSRDLYLRLGPKKLQLVFVPITFAVGLEFFQLLNFTNGTFDPVDLIFYILFWIIAFAFKTRRLEQDLFSPFTLRGFSCVACFLSVYLAHVSS